MKLLNFGSLNAQGIEKIVHDDDSRSLDLTAILKDMDRHKLDILGIQETHFGELEYLQEEKGY